MRLPSPLRPSRRGPARLLAFALLATVLAASLGCFHRGRARGGDAEEVAMPVPEFVFVAVENHNWSDIIVSLVTTDGRVTRIGTATGSTNSVLRFPGYMIAGGSTLQLTARAVGGRQEIRSERFVVQPGQQVTWTIETSLARSTLAVF